MFFYSRSQFVSWLRKTIESRTTLNTWYSPSQIRNIANNILLSISPKIFVPDPYSHDGWKGIDKFCELIFDFNKDIIVGKELTKKQSTQISDI